MIFYAIRWNETWWNTYHRTSMWSDAPKLYLTEQEALNARRGALSAAKTSRWDRYEITKEDIEIVKLEVNEL